MDPLMIAAAVVIVFLIFLAVYVFVDLAGLPGRVAVKYHHTQAHAVKVAGIVGLLAGGVLWPLALAWAFIDIKRLKDERAEADSAQFAKRLALLEARLAVYEGQDKEPAQ